MNVGAQRKCYAGIIDINGGNGMDWKNLWSWRGGESPAFEKLSSATLCSVKSTNIGNSLSCTIDRDEYGKLLDMRPECGDKCP